MTHPLISKILGAYLHGMEGQREGHVEELEAALDALEAELRERGLSLVPTGRAGAVPRYRLVQVRAPGDSRASITVRHRGSRLEVLVRWGRSSLVHSDIARYLRHGEQPPWPAICHGLQLAGLADFL